MSKKLLSTVLALSFLIAIGTFSNAEEVKPIADCSFCDNWRPYNSDGVTFTSKDAFVVTRNTLALPGCTPVKASIIQQGFDKDYLGDNSKPLPIYVLYVLKQDPKCERAISLIHTGTLVEVNVDQPQFGTSSERMELAIVQNMKHTYGERTSAKIRWYLVRHDYNAGDEGSGYGADIAASIEHRRVDEKLNEEWRYLLKVVEEKKRSELIRRQR